MRDFCSIARTVILQIQRHWRDPIRLKAVKHYDGKAYHYIEKYTLLPGHSPATPNEMEHLTPAERRECGAEAVERYWWANACYFVGVLLKMLLALIRNGWELIVDDDEATDGECVVSIPTNDMLVWIKQEFIRPIAQCICDVSIKPRDIPAQEIKWLGNSSSHHVLFVTTNQHRQLVLDTTSAQYGFVVPFPMPQEQCLSLYVPKIPQGYIGGPCVNVQPKKFEPSQWHCEQLLWKAVDRRMKQVKDGKVQSIESIEESCQSLKVERYRASS
ncbi:hypothetical protein HDV00_009868 [Rhizophlyctis rosea]|nr:hypothetical protein HDV00_009868 [Rhizophlyctis rosea]